VKKVDPYSHLIKRQPTHLCFVILGGEIPFVSVQVGNSINIDRLTKELVFLQLPEHVNRLPANQSTKLVQQRCIHPESSPPNRV